MCGSTDPPHLMIRQGSTIQVTDDGAGTFLQPRPMLGCKRIGHPISSRANKHPGVAHRCGRALRRRSPREDQVASNETALLAAPAPIHTLTSAWRATIGVRRMSSRLTVDDQERPGHHVDRLSVGLLVEQALGQAERCNLADRVFVGVMLWPRAVFGRVISGWSRGVRHAVLIESEASGACLTSADTVLFRRWRRCLALS
jgi:hypothetical protein